MPYTLDEFDRNGFAFPMRGIAADQAADWVERYEFYERFLGMKGRVGILRFKPHLAFTWMFDLIRHPAVLDAVERVVGPDILCVGSIVWIKDPNDGMFVSWHQDNVYTGFEPEIAHMSWMAMTASTPENGCVRFIPGSHIWEPQLHDETRDPKNLLSRGQALRNIDASNAVDAVLAPGQFSIHHECTVHGSDQNRTTGRRIGFSGIYCSPEMRSSIGRRSANIVRGVDRYQHWDQDPEPRWDLDPVCVEASAKFVANYDRNSRQSALTR
jgi:ectoine hydroxylase-related dioxygenase (phytanoyl-CoA dioxygenase family)